MSSLDSRECNLERPHHEEPVLPVGEDLESSMVVFLTIVSFVLVLSAGVFGVALLG